MSFLPCPFSVVVHLFSATPKKAQQPQSLGTAAARLVVHKQAVHTTVKCVGMHGQPSQALTNMSCCRDFHQWCPKREYNYIRQVVSPHPLRGNRQMQLGGDLWVGHVAWGSLTTFFPLCLLFLVLLSSDMRVCSVWSGGPIMLISCTCSLMHVTKFQEMQTLTKVVSLMMPWPLSVY